MIPVVGVAVVGAGPYGLSVAAHLSGLGLKPRVFGRSMQTWQSFMPKGMVLKSEGFAMALSHPQGEFTLGDYCAEQGVPYKAVGWPVPVEVFAAYGAAFQKRFVPEVEDVEVTQIIRAGDGFELCLSTGERFLARNVVMATGIRPFARMPAELASLPKQRLTHSSDHGDMSAFAGRHVAVLGGGASAMDIAAALHRAGGRATVITRRAHVRFVSPGSFRSVKDRLLAPMTPLGPGWKKYLCVKAPNLFRRLPAALRQRILARYLGPAPAWSVRDVIEAHVDVRRNSAITGAVVEGDRITLTITRGDRTASTLQVDHVIAATGYQIDRERFPALDDGIRRSLHSVCGTPVLSQRFEASVPHLFFVGTPSAASFGPVMRFVAGVNFAASRVSQEIARRERVARSDTTRWPVWVARPSRSAQL